MEKSLIEKMIEAKHDHDIVLVEVFNNGKYKYIPQYATKPLEDVDNYNSFNQIERYFCDATESYARHYDFDSINLNLQIGIIYDVNDIVNDTVKEGAEPLDEIVRFNTGSVKSYLNNKKTNIMDYEDYGFSQQGFIKFDKLMSSIESSGLQYNGPKSFDELKTKILNGEKFDITLSANLKTKEEEMSKEPRKEKPVEEKIKRLSLFKR